MSKSLSLNLCVILTAFAFASLTPQCSFAGYSAPGNPSPGSKVQTNTPKPVKQKPVKPVAPARRKQKPAPVQVVIVPTALESGVELLLQERYKGALPYLIKAVKTQGRDAAAWYWFGVWHERMGRFQEAQKYYTKALEIDPQFAPFSRDFVYPSDGKRIPLLDPKRPARVVPIEPIDTGVHGVPPEESTVIRGANVNDTPTEYKMPVYVPPEPEDGDAKR